MSLLDVGDAQRIHWEHHGNPDGIPVVCLHGGPGAGSSQGSRRLFDAALFRTVLFDQRGCGRSTPHVADPTVSLAVNTTWHLVEDIERLRIHLGIPRWLVFGGSWGSTLALAYAERYPESVTGLLLVAVTTSSPDEIDWLYRGARRFRPAEWDAFRLGAQLTDADPGSTMVIDSYARLIVHHDPTIRERAAADWCQWEDALLAHEPGSRPGSYSRRVDDARIAFARLCAHYFGHGAWLRPGQLVDDVHRIAHLPAELVHGRQDLSCPPDTVWRLAERWPAARLSLIEDAGHLGSAAFADAMEVAVDRLGVAVR
jgi:proline iminopeptidase